MVPNGVWIFDPYSETQFAPGLRDVDADSTGSLSCSLGHDGPWGHNKKKRGIWWNMDSHNGVYTPKWMVYNGEPVYNLFIHGWCGVTAILRKPPYSEIEPGTHGNSPRHFGRKNSNIRLSETKFTKSSKRPSHTCTDIEWYVSVLASYCPKYLWSFARVCNCTATSAQMVSTSTQNTTTYSRRSDPSSDGRVACDLTASNGFFPELLENIWNDLYYRFLEHVDLPEHLKGVTLKHWFPRVFAAHLPLHQPSASVPFSRFSPGSCDPQKGKRHRTAFQTCPQVSEQFSIWNHRFGCLGWTCLRFGLLRVWLQYPEISGKPSVCDHFL